MRNLSLALLLIIINSLHVCAQNISGKVIDDKTNDPIAYATVYIDGTTMGTMTDNEGNFALKVNSLPDNVMVSHVSYQLKMVPVVEAEIQDMTIVLKQKEIQINEIDVTDKNHRDRNLRIFKRNFLGEDRWGLNAQILNEEAILFYTEYEMIKVTAPTITNSKPDNLLEEMKMEKDSTSIQFKNKKGLGAISKEPLKVLLPDLGYEIQVDLIEFVYNYGIGKGYFYKGAYYFKTIEAKNDKDRLKFDKNRLKAYYNSNMHFCRSLYQNKLFENGYKVLKEIEKQNGNTKLVSFDFENFWERNKNDEVLLKGLKDQHLHILYYKDGKHPKDLTSKKGGIPIQSELYIKSDTCRIRKDGTMEGYEFMFTPEIGRKQVGAILPSDYLPKNQ